MQVSVFNVIILSVSWVFRELSYIYVHVCFKWLLLNVALYSFFGARSMGTNGASAQVFKRKEKTKINMAARLSWVAFQLPLSSFLFRKSVHQKTPRNVLKKYFFRLVLTRLNWGVNSQYLSRRHQREKTVVIVRKGSRRIVTVHFLWSEASLWVP